MSSDGGRPEAVALDEVTLRNWPLPMPGREGDKEERGRVLVVGGCHQMPGAAILAATSAFRAGAGKVTVATGQSIAQLVALAMPEARVIPLPETGDGMMGANAADVVAQVIGRFDAILIGPGMQHEEAVCALVADLLPLIQHDAAIVLDAYAMGVVRSSDGDPPFHAGMRVLLTPHAGEMAHLTGIGKEAVLDDPDSAARTYATRWNALVALKGAVTHIAAPDGRTWRNDCGNVGLATSGSGDTLAGIIAGLAARGAPLEQAAAWGVALHSRAGVRLAQRLGTLGYLAREIPGEIPALMHELATR